MSYSYLLDLYRIIDQRLEQIENDQAIIGGPSLDANHHRGRSDCLKAFKHYLQDQYHHQLPRRIQHSLKK